jgi:membrane fusion protein, multidrug efflux system
MYIFPRFSGARPQSLRYLLIFVALSFCFLQACSSSSPDAGAPQAKKGKKGRGRGDGGGAVPVVVAKVTRRDVPIEVSAIGNAEAYATINIVAQIGGQLQQIFFREGDYVSKGAKLFTIDPSQLEAQVAQAEANLAKDEALLTQSEANMAKDTANQKYARDQAERYAKLFEQGIISKEQGDQLKSTADALEQNLRADKAAIDSIRAQMRADQAAIRNMKVQLGYTTIYSPIDGRTGNLTVKPGNIVAPNASSIITIAQVSPIFVTFSVPETHLYDIRRYMAKGGLRVEATPQDGGNGRVTGELTFVDNNVDTNTGSIKLKGTFANADRQLWPGEYVNVSLRLAMQQGALVVPNQAVQTGQEGTFVYVVNDKGVAEMRSVTAGTRVDQDLVIDKGLDEGETVVTEGQLRLEPGSRVAIGGPNGPGGGGGRGGRGGRRGGATADAPGGDGAAGGDGRGASGGEARGAGAASGEGRGAGGDGAAGGDGGGRGGFKGKGKGRGKREPQS